MQYRSTKQTKEANKMEQPEMLEFKDIDISVKNLKELKEKMEFGVGYLKLNKNNELMVTSNHMYGKGAGVYISYNPNGIGKTLYANKEKLILNYRNFLDLTN